MKRRRRWSGAGPAEEDGPGTTPRLVAVHVFAIGLLPIAMRPILVDETELRTSLEVDAEYEARKKALLVLEQTTPPLDRDFLRLGRNEHGYGGQGLLVSPHFGFVHYESSCCGDWCLNLGTARWDGGDLELTPRFGRPEEPWTHLSCRYLVVPWGVRRYFVGVEELDRFVNEINLGLFDERGGSTWHTFDDVYEPLGGRPELPPEHAAHLLDAPVEGRVLASTRLEEVDAHGRWTCTFDLTLDAGERAGLWVGMELELVEDDGAFERAQVTTVAPERTHAVVRCLGAERHAAPARGWHASSRSRSSRSTADADPTEAGRGVRR